ncbi:DNA polymerase III subunit delta [Desulfovibrio inopinatus]|uniref:DNA polymerase III subunit delta n=1 Tax=Desulfovibrio inopinatus TaxID=102109 RepID=UPI000425373E|nr:hypothetical protein [Desulfovibrio inopinatus]
MDRPGFSFLVCPDPEMVQTRIASMLESHGGQATQGGQWKKIVFFGDEDSIPDVFWETLTVSSLLAEHKAIVLRRAQDLKVDFWKKLAPVLRGFNSHIWLFVCLEPTPDKRNWSVPKTIADRPYYKVAEKRKWVWQSPGVTRKTLPSLIRDWASARGLGFGRGALDTLATLLPEDMAAAARELEKIELVLEERTTIEVSDLAIVSYSQEIDMFTFLRSFADPQSTADIWRKIFKEQLAGNDSLIFQFLGLLAMEARQMWQLATGDDETIRLPQFVKEQKQTMAKRLGSPALVRMFDLAMEAEMGVKTGQIHAEQAMEQLSAQLFSLFAGRRPL